MVDGAATFFTDGLQLRVGRRFDRSFVELLGTAAPIYLLQKETGSEPFPDAETEP